MGKLKEFLKSLQFSVSPPEEIEEVVPKVNLVLRRCLSGGVDVVATDEDGVVSFLIGFNTDGTATAYAGVDGLLGFELDANGALIIQSEI